MNAMVDQSVCWISFNVLVTKKLILKLYIYRINEK